jgi:hypothetical protein
MLLFAKARCARRGPIVRGKREDHDCGREVIAYPKDLKQRAKVNEVMDWFNTGRRGAQGDRGVGQGARAGLAQDP